MSRPFNPRQITSFRAELEQIAGRLVDRLAGLGPEPVDLVEQLALPFASLSLDRLLAIPDDEAIRLGRLARQVGPVFEQFASAEQHRIVASAGEELVGRLAMIVSGHGDDGARDNLLAGLPATRAATGEEERLGTAVLLFGAGFDSPASMVGLGAKLLIECPQQACLVAGEATTASRAVAEILRYEPPVQLIVRVALEPAELADAEIGAGSMVIGLIAAANRDPARFKEPEMFDVTRDQVPSLSFGAGPHYCLGAFLSGLQGEVLFPRMLRRFPGLRMAGEPVYRSPGSTLRGLERLVAPPAHVVAEVSHSK